MRCQKQLQGTRRKCRRSCSGRSKYCWQHGGKGCNRIACVSSCRKRDTKPAISSSKVAYPDGECRGDNCICLKCQQKSDCAATCLNYTHYLCSEGKCHCHSYLGARKARPKYGERELPDIQRYYWGN